MPTHLPDMIDPLLCVTKGRHWRGKVALTGMSRLAGVITNPRDSLDVDLYFHRAGKVAAITGSLRGEVELVCQRCLEPLRIRVDSPVNLGVVSSIEEGDRLPEPYEPLLLGEDRISFADLVEDELLLAIPTIPRHGHCKPAGMEAGKTGQSNPFAALANLKAED